MEWQQYARELIDVLGLKGSPVAITYDAGSRTHPLTEPTRVCDAFQRVREGDVIDLTADNSACRGGSYYLGFSEAPSGDEASALNDFLVDGEKLYCSAATFHRSKRLVPRPPTGLADCVRLSPLEETTTRPDLVICVCNPEQGSRLLTLAQYESGIPPQVMMSGSTCYQAIAYPLVTGELNVSLMDFTTRRVPGYCENDLLVSIPYHRLHSIMRSIPFCSAGRAEIRIPDPPRAMTESKPTDS